MRIEYICHAALLVDTGDARIAIDPWFSGPAYCDQWFVFPKPVNTAALADVDVVLISHGHEDHLHELTLQSLPKSAKLFCPYTFVPGMKDFFESMGFGDVTEAVTFKRHALTPNTTVTFVTNVLDSIIVIESGGQVLVDVNDALHSSHPRVIELFTRAIRKQWPRIDFVYCGFGGASHFPNTFHMPGKDDEEIGYLRERLFAHNFCRIVQGLQPKVAVPFAADFALLEEEKHWINEVRFPREELPAYYQEHFGKDGASPQILPMYPGDVLHNGELVERSPYRDQLQGGGLLHLLKEQYGAEIEEKRRKKTHPITEQSAVALQGEIQANIVERSGSIAADLLERLKYTVRVTDAPAPNCFVVDFGTGSARVERLDEVPADSRVTVETRSEILRYSLASTWGGDAIVIGYGCEIHLADSDVVADGFDMLCIRLLTKVPEGRVYLWNHLARTAKYFFTNSLNRRWFIERMINRAAFADFHNTKLWLSLTKREICEICDMPLLDRG